MSYQRCCWEYMGKYCRYPGTMTSDTMANASSRWVCSGHFFSKNITECVDILEASQDYRHKTREEIESEFTATNRRYLEEHGLLGTNTAEQRAMAMKALKELAWKKI